VRVKIIEIPNNGTRVEVLIKGERAIIWHANQNQSCELGIWEEVSLTSFFNDFIDACEIGSGLTKVDGFP